MAERAPRRSIPPTAAPIPMPTFAPVPSSEDVSMFPVALAGSVGAAVVVNALDGEEELTEVLVDSELAELWVRPVV